MALRVGVDLVTIDSVKRSVESQGERYLQRVYTRRELADCATPDGFAPERLAARFAAKEATVKVLRPDSGQALPWRCMEVVRLGSGAVELELSGAALEMADAAGIEGLQLSLTHEGLQACAVVIAELRDGCR